MCSLMIVNMVVVSFIVTVPLNVVAVVSGLFGAGLGLFALAMVLVWATMGRLGYPHRRQAARWFMNWTVIAAVFYFMIVSFFGYVLLQIGQPIAFWIITIATGITIGSIGWNWIDRRRADRFGSALPADPSAP